MRLAEDIEPELYGSEQVTLLNRLEREHANCRLALEWCQAQGYVEPVCDSLLGLWMFWSMHGHVAEGSARLESLLARFPARGTDDQRLLLHAQARDAAGRLAGLEGDFRRGRSRLEEALGLMEVLDDTARNHECARRARIPGQSTGRFRSRACLSRPRAGGRPGRWSPSSAVANALYHLAILAHDQSENTRARALLESACQFTNTRVNARALGFTLSEPRPGRRRKLANFDLARAHTRAGAGVDGTVWRPPRDCPDAGGPRHYGDQSTRLRPCLRAPGAEPAHAG